MTVRNAQRLCNLVTEAMHYISHAYHSISDIMVDMGRTPPRELRAPPHGQIHAIAQQAIPVQVRFICYYTCNKGWSFTFFWGVWRRKNIFGVGDVSK